MKRTDASGNIANKFTDGNPIGGIPATVVEQTWLNTLQEEICYVIEQAGITLDQTGVNTTQLYTALQTLFATVTNYREKLTANRIYYVRTDGSDSNNGLGNTSGAAFLTLQKAADVAMGLDFGGFTVTIQVADGNYAGGLKINGRPVGGNLVIKGNMTTPTNVVFSTVGVPHTFEFIDTVAYIQGLKLVNSGGTSCLFASQSRITIEKLDFGNAPFYQLYIVESSSLSVLTGYTISGDTQNHYFFRSNSNLYAVGPTITLTGGTRSFTAFLYFEGNSSCVVTLTFSGSATGQRYVIHTNASVNTNGAGTGLFPGNAVGVLSSGGEYI